MSDASGKKAGISREERFPESTGIEGVRQEVSRMEPAMRTRILEALAGGPMTVPQLAESLGAEREETMRWVMGCWRYGYLAPVGGEDEDGYFKYALTDRE